MTPSLLQASLDGRPARSKIGMQIFWSKKLRDGKIEIAGVEILVEFVPGIQTFVSTCPVIIAVALLLKHMTQTRIDQV